MGTSLSDRVGVSQVKIKLYKKNTQVSKNNSGSPEVGLQQPNLNQKHTLSTGRLVNWWCNGPHCQTVSESPE